MYGLWILRFIFFFLLKEKGLTIQEIANELGVSKPTISAEIENGVDVFVPLFGFSFSNTTGASHVGIVVSAFSSPIGVFVF